MNGLELKVPPLAVMVILGVLMWLAANFQALDIPLGDFSLWMSGVLFLLGAAFSLLGVLRFRVADTTVNPLTPDASSTLVRTGVYRISRNPMYLGFLLLLLALAAYLANLLSLLLAVCFVPYMSRFQIVPEERMLTELFGDEFEDYKATVRRWL